LGGGLIAGVINAMAGGGSALTVPLLMLVGLDANVANGTNRLAVLAQAGSSGWSFHQRGVRPWALARRAAPVAIAGALLGAYLATRLSAPAMEQAFGVVFLALAVFFAVRPKSLDPTEMAVVERPGWGALVGLFGVGLYGGLFQAGVGVPLLLVAVRGLGLDLLQGNALKVAVIGVYTALVLVIFGAAGHLAWQPGLVLAVGGLVGSRLGVGLAVRRGAGLVRWVVVLALGAAGLRALL
jgi:hypothetical protein